MPVDRNADTDQVNKQRTLQQNKAAHKWFEESAEVLNDSGADMQVILSKRLGIQWTPEAFKEVLFKAIIRAAFNKKSTTELTTKEITQAVELLTDAIAKDSGIVLPHFPSMEGLELERKTKS